MRRLRRAFTRGERRQSSAEDALRRALLLVVERELDAAQEILAAVVRRDSDEIDAYLTLARVYRLQGEIGRAIRIHQNLLLRKDLDEDQRTLALAGLAGDFRQGGFLRRSIAAYEELLDRSPKHRAALRALVRLLADARDFPRALQLENRLARLEGRERRTARAPLQLEMAEALRAEGRQDEARRVLRKALRGDPRLVRGWILLGEIEVEQGRAKQAIDAWKRVPDLDRRAASRAYQSLMAVHEKLGRGADYKRFLEARLEADPDEVEARLALARWLLVQGAGSEAKAHVRRVLEREPDRLEAHAALGRVLLAEPSEPELAKQLAELLDVLDRQGLLRQREDTR